MIVVAIIAYDEPERRPDKRNDQWKRNNRRSSLPPVLVCDG